MSKCWGRGDFTGAEFTSNDEGARVALSMLFGSRKAIASTVVLALVVATPVTLAIVHEGFPISDVELNANDVWVTNGTYRFGGNGNW